MVLISWGNWVGGLSYTKVTKLQRLPLSQLLYVYIYILLLYIKKEYNCNSGGFFTVFLQIPLKRWLIMSYKVFVTQGGLFVTLCNLSNSCNFSYSISTVQFVNIVYKFNFPNFLNFRRGIFTFQFI